MDGCIVPQTMHRRMLTFARLSFQRAHVARMRQRREESSSLGVRRRIETTTRVRNIQEESEKRRQRNRQCAEAVNRTTHLERCRSRWHENCRSVDRCRSRRQKAREVVERRSKVRARRQQATALGRGVANRRRSLLPLNRATISNDA